MTNKFMTVCFSVVDIWDIRICIKKRICIKIPGGYTTNKDRIMEVFFFYIFIVIFI